MRCNLEHLTTNVLQIESFSEVVVTICEETLEFSLNNTNLTFLAFLYKIDIKGFQNQQKNKVASSGNQTHNTNHFTTQTYVE